MHVDPHITNYTVYITDMYTNDSIIKANVTETHYTYSTQDSSLCLMYQVSAWNAGGEGEICDAVWDSTPQGKLRTLSLGLSTVFTVLALLSFITVPRSVAAENISVSVAVEVLHIHIDASFSCVVLSHSHFL